MQGNKDAFEYLTGATTGGARPEAVGKKFTPDGRPIRCPGFTTICHVAPSSAAFAALARAQEILKAGPLADAYAFLPPESFHMTIFEGVIEYSRTQAQWPHHLELDIPVDAVVRDAQSRLTGLELAEQFVARPTGMFGGFSVRMTGFDDGEEGVLRDTRDQLREATQILREDHETYQFHITLGYLLRWLTPSEAEDMIDLSDQVGADLVQQMKSCQFGPVELCRFETMTRFDRIAAMAR